MGIFCLKVQHQAFARATEDRRKRKVTVLKL